MRWGKNAIGSRSIIPLARTRFLFVFDLTSIINELPSLLQAIIYVSPWTKPKNRADELITNDDPPMLPNDIPPFLAFFEKIYSVISGFLPNIVLNVGEEKALGIGGMR